MQHGARVRGGGEPQALGRKCTDLIKNYHMSNAKYKQSKEKKQLPALLLVQKENCSVLRKANAF